MTGGTVPADVRRARLAFGLVGVLAPIIVLAAAEAVLAAWLPSLPDPAATHWGLTGADGFGPRWTLLLNPAIGAGIVLVFAAVALASSRMTATPTWSPSARAIGAMNLAAGVLIGVVVVVTTSAQRGLESASDARDIAPGMLVGFALALAAGVVGWHLQPTVSVRSAPAPHDGVVEPVGEEERLAWFGSVAMARSGWIVLGAGLGVSALSTVFALARDPRSGGAWIPLGVTVLLVILVAVGVLFRVRVTASGLRVRSALGWPDTRIPIDDIAEVEVVVVDPLGEFGGWGWRFGVDGRRGVVLRRGEALQVMRRSGRIFVVTVDGAAEAASVLQALRSAGAGRKDDE